MLELASSPGRIVGDARGRWGLGAVPRPGGTEPPAKLAAALHVFGAAAEEAPPEPGAEAAAAVPVAVLIEPAAGTAGVMQLLSDGEGAPYDSPTANAIVLSSTSRQTGDNPQSTSIRERQLPERVNCNTFGESGVRADPLSRFACAV